VFLTVGRVRYLLQATGAAKRGEKAAAAALATMQRRGWLVDTGETKRPRRRPESVARAERFGDAHAGMEGGHDVRHHQGWQEFV
jgi:hypothetical protein